MSSPERPTPALPSSSATSDQPADEVDYYAPVSSAAYDYTEGATADELAEGIEIAARSRRDSQHTEGASIFDGPGAASVPSSVVSFRHSYVRPGLSWRDSHESAAVSSDFGDDDAVSVGRAARRGWSSSRTRSGEREEGYGTSRPASPAASSAHHRSRRGPRSRARSDASSSSPLLSPTDEGAPRQSGMFSGLAAMFGSKPQEEESGTPSRRHRPSLSARSSSGGGSRATSRSSRAGSVAPSEGASDSDSNWGYSSNEEISDDDASSDMASSAAPSLNNSDTSSFTSARRRSNDFLPTGTFATDPVFGDTRIQFESPPPSPLLKPVDGQSRQKIHIQEEDVTLLFIGYRASRWRKAIWAAGTVVSLGALGLLGRWVPTLWLKATASEKPFVSKDGSEGADFVVVETQWGDINIYPISSAPFPYPLSSVFPHDAPSRQAYLPPSTAASLKGKAIGTGNGTGNGDFDAGPALATDEVGDLKFVEYRYTRFILHQEQGQFRMIRDWRDPKWATVSAVLLGLQETERDERKALFGPNAIEIEERGWLQLFIDEVLHPFYIFQVASIILWTIDDYYYYAACIALISIASVTTTLIETKRTIKRMKEMSRFNCQVRALINGAWTVIDSTELLPGDIFEASDPALNTVPCDALLLSGDAIVNESMLTGESVPVAKVPVKDDALKPFAREPPKGTSDVPPAMAKHFLFSGTKIIRVRGAGIGPDGHEAPALALVVRTGFNTTKGALVRSMLFPKPMGFKFYRDSMRFIGVLAIIAGLGFLASSVNFIKLGIKWHTIMLRALDLITIVVPPALPATMSIGTTFAINRLRKKNIFCISPTRVNVGGKINVVCFDKTGTLTEDGLDILGIRTIERSNNRFAELHTDISELPAEGGLGGKTPLLYALATCHALKAVDNEIIGDPLDVKMFEFTQWSLEEGKAGGRKQPAGEGKDKDKKHKTNGKLPERPAALVQTVVRPPGGEKFKVEDALKAGTKHAHFLELGVIRTFDFVSSLRRMSVVVKRLKSPSMEVYVKGAPEVMADICDKDSFPEDYDDLLSYYTKHGYRVIAVAGKSLPGLTWIKAQRMKREQAESGLRFLGLIIFENKLKPGTTPAIHTLRSAHLAVRMVTGDNPRTAISVARECGLISAPGHVFMPTFLEGGPQDPHSRLEWSSADDEKLKLDPYSLRPFVDDDDRSRSIDLEYQDYHLAVTGDVFRWMIDFAPLETLQRMLVKSQIFARMSPDEKCELVERLQQLGYTVGFCGDGANDCGALKAADVGLSLSEAEASVAAPFTSNTPDISCFIEVIKEGRAALVTSFACFKYMALYSLIQFTSITLLYSFASSLGDFQFLAIDLAIILPIAVTMGRTLPYPRIHPKRPTANLVSKKVLSSIIGQIVICAAIQFFVFFDVRQQPWYEEPDVNVDKLETENYENSALFLVSCFQYILVALVFSVGPPYRKPLWTNPLFLLALTLLSAFALYIMFVPSGFFFDLLELVRFPITYHYKLLAIVIVNVILSLAYERWGERRVAKLVGTLSRKWRQWRRGDGRKLSGKEYKRVEGGWQR